MYRGGDSIVLYAKISLMTEVTAYTVSLTFVFMSFNMICQFVLLGAAREEGEQLNVVPAAALRVPSKTPIFVQSPLSTLLTLAPLV